MLRFCIIGPHERLMVLRNRGVCCFDAESTDEAADRLKILAGKDDFSAVYIAEDFYNDIHSYVIKNDVVNIPRIKVFPSSQSGNIGVVRDLMMTASNI